MRIVCAFLLLPLLVCVPSANAQEKKKNVDISGTWRYEYELQGQSRKDSLQLVSTKDGSVTGVYQGVPEKPIDISTGKVDGDNVELDLAFDYQGVNVKVKFTGKVKGDDIVGRAVAKHPEGELAMDWVAKRGVEPADVVGEWELEINAGDQVLEPKIVFKLDGKDLKGRYVDSNSNVEADLEKVRVEKNNVKFTINVKMDVGNIKADFSGRPYGNKISGTIEYTLNGDPGQIEYTGVRKTPKKSDAKPSSK